MRSSSWAGRNPAATSAGANETPSDQTPTEWSTSTGKSNAAATAENPPDPGSTSETTPKRFRSLRPIYDWLRHWGGEFWKSLDEVLGHDYSTPVRYPPRRHTGGGGVTHENLVQHAPGNPWAPCEDPRCTRRCADATLSAAAGNLVAMLTVIDRATYDRIADDLAVIACTKGDPHESDHNHAACLETPGALLADHLWRIVAPLAEGNGKAARIAVRRLDQAMGAGEIHQ